MSDLRNQNHQVQSVPVTRQQYWVHQTRGILPQETVYSRQPVPVLPLARDVLAVAASARVWVGVSYFEVSIQPCMQRSCVSSWRLLIKKRLKG